MQSVALLSPSFIQAFPTQSHPWGSPPTLLYLSYHYWLCPTSTSAYLLGPLSKGVKTSYPHFSDRSCQSSAQCRRLCNYSSWLSPQTSFHIFPSASMSTLYLSYAIRIEILHTRTFQRDTVFNFKSRPLASVSRQQSCLEWLTDFSRMYGSTTDHKVMDTMSTYFTNFVPRMQTTGWAYAARTIILCWKRITWYEWNLRLAIGSKRWK